MPTDDGPVPWMLLDAVEGSPWALPEDLSSIDGSIYRWIAAQLRLVHGIRASGAGAFDAEGRPSATSWTRWLIDRIDGLFAETGLPDEGFQDRLIAAIGRQQELLDSRPIGLVHADLGNREILVGEDAAPQGFVDFGNAIFGDTILDLAGFMRGGLPDDRRPPHMLPPLVEAYYEGITPPDRFVWLWTLYGIVHDLHNIRWSQRECLEDWVPPLWAAVRRSVMLLELPA